MEIPVSYTHLDVYKRQTLDSEYGFPHIYCREPDVWDPEKVVEELGSRWFFTEYHYKPYPVCRYLHSVLDAFAILQEKYRCV